MGINPPGLFLKRKNKPTNTATSITNTNGVLFIQPATPFVYPLFTLLKPRLNAAKNFSKKFLFAAGSFEGFSINVHKAGVSDNATNADITTEAAMVMANCWYKRPTIPGIKPTGTNTAASISAIAITGPDISFMAFFVASFGDIFS